MNGNHSLFGFTAYAACMLAVGAHAVGDDRESERLHQLFAERYEWEMREFPETAMSRGDYSHADRITDVSLAAIVRRNEDTARHLERLLAIDRDNLDAADRLNYDLFRRMLEDEIEAHRYRTYLMPIGPRSGPQQTIPQMHERVRFDHGVDYANYLTRLEQVPLLISRTLETLRAGVAAGRTPPAVVLAGVPGQLDTLIDGGIRVLAEPFERMPPIVTKEEGQPLRRRFDGSAIPAVRAALSELRDFLAKEYIPHCRASIAASDLPDGPAYYGFCLARHTTTAMTAQEIHNLGLSEVARIKTEMMKVIRSSDFMQLTPNASELSDDELFNAFIHYLRSNPRFYHHSPEELLNGYRAICKRIDGQLPRFFKTLPRLPYGVRDIPAYMAPTQTTAYYQEGDARNAQAGWFYANTYRLDQRPKYEMIALAMHEAVPGHHLQIALAQGLEGLPEFRKHTWVTAFGEGWALYAERLGIEMNLYTDPYDDFGRLLYEMWRACRLVVDTGIHALGWSRDRAIAFMRDHSALSELNIRNEVDRYIAWPGQATAYKIGELKIRELRRLAEARLGHRFNLREFHDVILSAGCLPLNILERRVHEWLEKAGAGENVAAPQ